VSGLLLVLVGLGLLAVSGVLAAYCLRLRSWVEILLAAYVVAWAWIVAAALLLSPARVLMRGTLLGALLAGAGIALAAWLALGRPQPPPLRPRLGAAREAFARPVVLVLAVAVALGTAYVAALAFLTPANDWDALSYHLARAAFWKQEHGVVLIEGVADDRLNVNPPNAEIGQLATMLLAGSDRYVALPQLLAYAALALCVAGLARRIGLGAAEAAFSGLAFATLPVVALQASGALNDLVAASFLAAAVYFAVGEGRASLLLAGLAVALAVGVKFSAPLALPTLAIVLALGLPRRRWPGAALAGVAGLALGSVWYAVNVAETGSLDGGSAEETEQRADASPGGAITRALRLSLSFVDMSGADWPYSAAFLVAAAVLGALALALPRARVALLVGAGATACVAAAPLVWDLGVRAVYRAGLLLGQDELVRELSWELNTKAEPTRAWYGPLAPVLLLAATAAVLLAWRHGRLPRLAVAFALAPWLLLATLAVTLTWDPWRGRFLVFGVALAAATWGLVLRWRWLAPAAAAIASAALFLTLANYEGKWSGLLEERSIWGNPRWEAQTRLSGPREVHRFVEESVPEDAHVGVALPGNHHLHPYFGEEVSRHVSLPGGGESPPEAEAEWIVVAPGTDVPRCPDAWRMEFEHGGWSIERRVGPDDCPVVG
jgi:hypothetical protein